MMPSAKYVFNLTVCGVFHGPIRLELTYSGIQLPSNKVWLCDSLGLRKDESVCQAKE